MEQMSTDQRWGRRHGGEYRAVSAILTALARHIAVGVESGWGGWQWRYLLKEKKFCLQSSVSAVFFACYCCCGSSVAPTPWRRRPKRKPILQSLSLASAISFPRFCNLYSSGFSEILAASIFANVGFVAQDVRL
eukprot:TRINITY_DN11740_c0_g2_i2.p1 TRINITY_DN11740_c0_g2~~TRINITY_DN11740_c0_g2_i2.p1  ORF type:complete len:134 (-),score=16.50 TRINITY_DN11740_c0_g2_i2:319-720(-)